MKEAKKNVRIGILWRVWVLYMSVIGYPPTIVGDQKYGMQQEYYDDNNESVVDVGGVKV